MCKKITTKGINILRSAHVWNLLEHPQNLGDNEKMNTSDLDTEKKILYAGKHLLFMQRNGWEFVERTKASGIVVVAALTKHNGVVLVSQRREPVQSRVIELPAGLAGDEAGKEGELLEEAARRELWEETGFTGDVFEPIIEGPPGAGVSSEYVSFYRVRGAVRMARGGGGAGEDIRVHVIPLKRLEDWLSRCRELGAMIDPKVYVGVYFLQHLSAPRKI